MTDYVATRWYRAPELVVGSEDYTKAIDVWSIGCILAELLTRKPFLPGTSNENQLKLICRMVGAPSRGFIKSHNIEDFDIPEDCEVNKDGETAKFIKRFSKIEDDARDLLKKMLAFDPTKRITIEQILEHSFFEELHEPDDEPVTSYVQIFDFDFEKFNLSVSQSKQLMYDEILLYHSLKAQKKYVSNRENFPEGMLTAIHKKNNQS